MATANAKLPPPPSSNGVITGPPKGVVGGNRKKQKRRAKQAAAKGAPLSHQQPPPGGLAPSPHDYDEDPLDYGDGDDHEDYISESEYYHEQYAPSHMGEVNGYGMPPPANPKKRNKKKKGSVPLQHEYNPELLGNEMPRLPNIPLPPPSSSHHALVKPPGGGSIWNTSTQQERQNIKDFWLSLSEEERKSLLKIEKEAVLRKMKQQQKHSCSCTVCGRKRTAIEEELEVLYEGYYEELEQYAHHDHPPLPAGYDGMMPDPLQQKRPHPLAAPPPAMPMHSHAHGHSHQHPNHRMSQLTEHFDDEEFSDEDDEEEYSDDDYSDEDEQEVVARAGIPDFFNFGQNLTVKDNLLTVADDLLKNDGRKFIEMMEQLAERRMQRETEAEYNAANPTHPGAYPPGDPTYGHDDPLAAGDEFDDDDGSYDSQDYDDDELEEEDEMGGLTEEQRMQEGRRMFQIFAARMFEQRVSTAYKEKVAAERQQRLLEELEDETKLEAQREAKKQRDAQKKKDKKKQQQQAKAEEKAKKEAEKLAEEARIKEAEEKKLEEQRKKKEEQRKKKEEEKRKLDEERVKKEAERTKRLQEEQQRKEDAERKAREQKAAEKAKKDEARKRERDEREAREKEAKERKAQEDKEKREHDERMRAEAEAAKQRERSALQAAPPPQPQIQKRPSQPAMVAVPGTYPKQSLSGVSSPHPVIATPAIPKAPTPAKPRQASQQGSLASSPKQSSSQISSIPSKSSSPNSTSTHGQQQQQQSQPLATTQPRTILQKAPQNSQQQQLPYNQQHPTQQVGSPPLQPPPGMPYPQQQHPPGFNTLPPMGGFPTFQAPQGSMMQGNVSQRGQMPMYPHQTSQLSARFGAPGMNGPPPGMMAQQQNRQTSYPYDRSTQQPPPGFNSQHAQQPAPIGQPLPPSSIAPGSDVPRLQQQISHSRQTSTSEKERFESAANQPIARPAPIQRPSSVKPQSRERRSSNTDLDDLSKHLGSSALLDDSDEGPLPTSMLSENRRTSGMPIPPNRMAQAPIGAGFGAPGSGFGAPGASAGSWGNTPSLPFGQSRSLGQSGWNSGLGSWNTNSAAFAANSAFGSLGSGHPPLRTSSSAINRPLTIRLAVCDACQRLSSANHGQGDGFHPIDVLLRQIEVSRPMLDGPPSYREIEDICETEGDSQNGGGELHVRRNGFAPESGKFAVMWAPDASTPDHPSYPGGRLGGGGLQGLGEIGSPLPGKAMPVGSGFGGAIGMGRSGAGPVGGFQGLGAVGSPPGGAYANHSS